MENIHVYNYDLSILIQSKVVENNEMHLQSNFEPVILTSLNLELVIKSGFFQNIWK